MLNIPTTRHPSTQHFRELFDSAHLPDDLATLAAHCEDAAQFMIDELGDGPELSDGLRNLLRAKDCFVRQRVKDLAR